MSPILWIAFAVLVLGILAFDLGVLSRRIHLPSPREALARTALFVALWSGGYAFAKIGLAHAEPMTFLSLRFGFALLILAGVFLIMRPPLPESAAQWRHLLVSGLRAE